MKALVGAFNQEKALVGIFSVIVQLHLLIDLRQAARGPDTDTEMDSGFTETESGSGDRSAYTSSAGSTGHPASYLHDSVSQVR